MKKLYVASATPFSKEGEINEKALKLLWERNLAEGADGFFIGGSSGECFLLSREERVHSFELPESDCYILPDSLSDEEAVMIEPTTIGIQACTRAELQKDDMLLIYGSGALGSSILKTARLQCDHIIVADIQDDKLAAAKKNGATHTINTLTENLLEKVKEYTEDHGATVSIDAVCSKDSLSQLLEATGNAGRVITMGFSTSPTEVNQFVITSRELDIRGSRLQNKMFGKAIDFIDSRDPSIRKIVLTFDF